MLSEVLVFVTLLKLGGLGGAWGLSLVMFSFWLCTHALLRPYYIVKRTRGIAKNIDESKISYVFWGKSRSINKLRGYFSNKPDLFIQWCCKKINSFPNFFYEEVWTVSFWGLATLFLDWILTKYVMNVVFWWLKVSKVAFFMH